MPRVGHLVAWDIPDEPGTRTWHYMRNAEGDFKPLSSRAYRAFFDEKAPWPGSTDENGFAHLATFSLEVKARTPGRIVREYFTKHRVLGTGFLDEEFWMAGQGTKSEVVFAKIVADSDRGDRFAERRLQNLYSWVPTERDVTALVELLTKRGVPRFN